MTVRWGITADWEQFKYTSINNSEDNVFTHM